MEMVFPMMKARIAEASDPTDRRQSPRVPVELEVKMRELGASGVEARVLNISERGFMAESDARFEVDGTEVTATRLDSLADGRRVDAEKPVFLDDTVYPFKPNPHFAAWLPLTEHPEFSKWKFGTQTGELWAALGSAWVGGVEGQAK